MFISISWSHGYVIRTEHYRHSHDNGLGQITHQIQLGEAVHLDVEGTRCFGIPH